MNKILMDGDIFKLESSMDIIVEGSSTIYIYDLDNDIDLNIDMKDDTKLLILDFNTNSFSKKVRVKQSNNTTVNYVHTFKITGEYNFDYCATITGNNNINNININGITSGSITTSIDAVAKEGTKNNELNENIKILNLGGKVKTLPMLHISCLDVIANHNTAISNIRKDDLFYLNSKGISEMGAINLIQDGYLYGLFKDYQEFLSLIR